MFFENKITLQQKQNISMQQIQSLDILVCTNQEIEKILMEEFLINPILDYSSNKKDNLTTNIDTMYEKGTMVSSGNKIKEDLFEQLNMKKYTKEQGNILVLLIDYLEEDGFFFYDIAEIAKGLKVDIKVVEYCLNELKQLEPPGVFSATLEECLISQLDRLNIQDVKLVELISNYMGEVIKGNINKVSKLMNLNTKRIKEYLNIISTLNPRPILNFSTDEIEYVVPDIIIKRNDNQWEITINDGWIGDFKYNDYYLKLMKETEDVNLLEYFRKNYDRAKFIITSVEQRRCTLIKVIEVILDYQSDYFLAEGNLKPMKLYDIAQKSGVHMSTVSRAIKGKYMQYKNTIMIKDIFNMALGESNGNGISIEYIKEIIKKVIDEEGDKSLSDNQIANILEDRGISISRRTIAKYRLEMGILDSQQRKYWCKS